MGASGWHYFTPYQPDVGLALQMLREKVFKDRSYQNAIADPPSVAKYMATLDAVDPAKKARLRRAALAAQKLPHLLRNRRITENPSEFEDFMMITQVVLKGDSITDDDIRHIEAYYSRFNIELDSESPSSGPMPKTIEELVEHAAEDGTHSILDIERVSDGLDFGAVAPMPVELLLKIYGTEKPTRSDIEAHQYEATENIERWQGYYTVVYENEQPSEFYFEGVSGD